MSLRLVKNKYLLRKAVAEQPLGQCEALPTPIFTNRGFAGVFLVSIRNIILTLNHYFILVCFKIFFKFKNFLQLMSQNITLYDNPAGNLNSAVAGRLSSIIIRRLVND